MARCPNDACRASVSDSLAICPRCGMPLVRASGAPGLNYQCAPARSQDVEPVDYLEIELGRGKRWWGMIGYVLFVLVVAGAFTAVFVRFTGSIAVAVGVVAFMLVYMVVMGALASRNLRRTRDEDQLTSGDRH